MPYFLKVHVAGLILVDFALSGSFNNVRRVNKILPKTILWVYPLDVFLADMGQVSTRTDLETTMTMLSCSNCSPAPSAAKTPSSFFSPSSFVSSSHFVPLLVPLLVSHWSLNLFESLR